MDSDLARAKSKRRKQKRRTVQHLRPILVGYRHKTASNQKIFVYSGSRQQAGEPLPERDAPTTFDKSHAAFVQSHRVLIILLHELLDRQQMWLIMIAEVLRQPDLFVER